MVNLELDIVRCSGRWVERNRRQNIPSLLREIRLEYLEFQKMLQIARLKAHAEHPTSDSIDKIKRRLIFSLAHVSAYFVFFCVNVLRSFRQKSNVPTSTSKHYSELVCFDHF